MAGFFISIRCTRSSSWSLLVNLYCPPWPSVSSEPHTRSTGIRASTGPSTDPWMTPSLHLRNIFERTTTVLAWLTSGIQEIKRGKTAGGIGLESEAGRGGLVGLSFYWYDRHSFCSPISDDICSGIKSSAFDIYAWVFVYLLAKASEQNIRNKIEFGIY